MTKYGVGLEHVDVGLVDVEPFKVIFEGIRRFVEGGYSDEDDNEGFSGRLEYDPSLFVELCTVAKNRFSFRAICEGDILR